MSKYTYALLLVFLFILTSCAVRKNVADSDSSRDDILNSYLRTLVDTHESSIQSATVHTVSGSKDLIFSINQIDPVDKDTLVPVLMELISFLKEEDTYEYIYSLHDGLGYINIQFIYEIDRSKTSHVYYCHSFSINDPTLESDWNIVYDYIE